MESIRRDLTVPACQELEGEPVSAMSTPSYGQRSLWFLQHLALQGGAYNIAAAARFGPDFEREISRRHR